MATTARQQALFHHRWNLPVIADLHRTAGSRFVVLLNRLGVSRDSLTHTLDALMQARWVRRNPGYGHPLRPEYILTKSGMRIGPHCQALTGELERHGLEEAGLRKWSMPVLLAIAQKREHFAEIKAVLPGLTARALSLALQDLQEMGLVGRTVVDEHPPTTRYTLTQNAKALAKTLADLASAL